MNNIIQQKDYFDFLQKIKERVRSRQYDALKAVNKELIDLYWDIGKMIVEKQEKEGWGKSVVESLSLDLQKEFPGMSGFSARNIWYMRSFFVLYSKSTKLQPLVAEIGWTHNIIIMDRCKDDLEREFYIRMTKKYGWTKNVLAMKIEGKVYKNTLINQTNFDKTIPETIKNQAKLSIKDEYTFGFLELAENHREKDKVNCLPLSKYQFCYRKYNPKKSSCNLLRAFNLMNLKRSRYDCNCSF